MKIVFTLFLATAFVFQISAQCQGSEPLISQVIEGSSNNKAVEIYNPTGMPLDLSGYRLVRFANGGGSGTNIALSGIVAPGEVFVIANPSSEAAILAVADVTNSTISHNGNDSYVLETTGGTTVDSYGDTDNSATFGANMNMQRDLTAQACPYDLIPDDNFVAADYISTAYTTGLPPGLGQNIGLPVTLSNFDVLKADAVSVQLVWSTSSEINNSHFEIMHSSNGVDFKVISRVVGAGYSNDIQEYNFVHENLTAGNHYYKLKQVDFDNKSEVFNVKMISIEKNNSIRLFPTVSYGEINIEGVEDGAEIQIFSTVGQLVQTVKLNNATIDLSELSAGSYFLKADQSILSFVKM